MTDGHRSAPHVLEHGRGADTLVLLHGFGGTAGVWDGIVRNMPSTVRVLAYDLPGHGRSLDVPARGASDMAAAILADLDAREVGRFRLCGHSLGGAVATLMAASAPHRIASLLLLSPGGFGPQIAGGALRRFAEAVSLSQLGEALSAMQAPGSPVSGHAVAALAAARAISGQTARLVELAGRIARDDRQGMFPAEVLDRLVMPVTVAWGCRDPVLPFSQTSSLPARFELRALDGAGHMLIEEAPEAVLEMLIASAAT
jgi:pimeloyl-ACP methyl ester carboxylesterase